MRLSWPFGRRARPVQTAVESPTADAAPPVLVGRPAWRDLPPLQRAVDDPPLIAPARPFRQRLAGAQPPAPVLARSLGHQRSRQAPAGSVRGIATLARPVTDEPADQPGASTTSVVSRAMDGARRWLQRRARPASTATAPQRDELFEASVGDAAAKAPETVGSNVALDPASPTPTAAGAATPTDSAAAPVSPAAGAPGGEPALVPVTRARTPVQPATARLTTVATGGLPASRRPTSPPPGTRAQRSTGSAVTKERSAVQRQSPLPAASQLASNAGQPPSATMRAIAHEGGRVRRLRLGPPIHGQRERAAMPPTKPPADEVEAGAGRTGRPAGNRSGDAEQDFAPARAAEPRPTLPTVALRSIARTTPAPSPEPVGDPDVPRPVSRSHRAQAAGSIAGPLVRASTVQPSARSPFDPSIAPAGGRSAGSKAAAASASASRVAGSTAGQGRADALSGESLAQPLAGGAPARRALPGQPPSPDGRLRFAAGETSTAEAISGGGSLRAPLVGGARALVARSVGHAPILSRAGHAAPPAAAGGPAVLVREPSEPPADLPAVPSAVPRTPALLRSRTADPGVVRDASPQAGAVTSSAPDQGVVVARSTAGSTPGGRDAAGVAVQAQAESAGEMTTAPAPAAPAAGGEPAAHGGMDERQMEELLRRMYPKLRVQLARELLVARERSGLLIDLQ